MSETPTRLYGLLAEFDEPRDLVAAARAAREAGYRHMDGYSPFPVHGLSEALAIPRSRLPFVFFLAGLTGGVGGFLLQYWCTVVAYPLNIGGRPLNSWPLYIPISFELTVLIAALTGVFFMFARNGLPAPHHPLFNLDEFDRASDDGFFLCIEATDPQFDLEETTAFLKTLNPTAVLEAPE